MANRNTATTPEVETQNAAQDTSIQTSDDTAAMLAELEAKLAAAEAKAAEAEAKAAEIEAKAKAKPIGAKADQSTEDERVELYVPKDTSNDDPNLLIGLNGVNYLLPRGKTSLVPPAVKAEYMRSVRAQERMDDRIDEMLESAKEK